MKEFIVEHPLYFYLIGAVIIFIISKSIRNLIGQNKWRDVGATILMSLCSWVGLLVFIVAGLVVFIEIYMKNNKPNPPRWL